MAISDKINNAMQGHGFEASKLDHMLGMSKIKGHSISTISSCTYGFVLLVCFVICIVCISSCTYVFCITSLFRHF